MYNVRKLTDDLTWIGVSDRKITKFENVYKLNSGMNYNSYFLDCGASILIDTVDKALEDVFFDNLAYCLNGRSLDYIIVQHMEPDHSANIMNFIKAYPEAKIVASDKAFVMMKNFFGTAFEDRQIVVGADLIAPLS